MAAIEALEDIKELNARHADIKIEQMLTQKREQEKQYELLKKQLEEEEDEAEIRYVRYIFIQSNLNFFFCRRAFGKSIAKADPDANEESEEQTEEILPLSMNATKPKVSLSIVIFQQYLYLFVC
jgi:hypothetical protein